VLGVERLLSGALDDWVMGGEVSGVACFVLSLEGKKLRWSDWASRKEGVELD